MYFQGLSPTSAEKWLCQLPAEKVPKSDSDGAKYRELQLSYQLPKQDLSLEHCHHVAPGEQRNAYLGWVS